MAHQRKSLLGATSEDLDEWHEVMNVPESHGDVVTNPEFPHNDVEDDEDDEDDKNAKTGETPIYSVSLKIVFHLYLLYLS